MTDTSLPIEQVVYVPSTNKQQKAISQQETARRVAEVKRFLSQKFGGYTSEKVEGGYKMGKHLVKEKIVKVTSFATKQAFNKNKSKLVKQLRIWGKKWKQDSIGYEHEGDLFYIKPSKQITNPITLKQMTEKNSPSWIERQIKPWK